MKSVWRLARITTRRSLRRFRKDNAGTTAIEFAMISVPFLGLIGAILETGSVYFRTAQLQMATETASRILLTNNGTAGLTKQAFINANICTWMSTGTVKAGTLSKMFDCSKVMIDVQSATGVWGTFDTTGADIYKTNTYNSGATLILPASGQVAVVRILYPMPVLGGLIGGGVFKGQTVGQIRTGSEQYNSKWIHMLTGMYAFRVEPT